MIVVVLAPAALVLIVLAFVLAWLKRLVRRHGAFTVLWRFASGQPLDGQFRTNATFTMPSRGDRPVLHPTGHASRRWHWPQWYHTVIRFGAVFGTITITAGIILAPLVTGIILAVLATTGIAHQIWRLTRWVRRYRRYRTWERPAHRAITEEIGAPPAKLEISYNEAQRPCRRGRRLRRGIRPRRTGQGKPRPRGHHQTGDRSTRRGLVETFRDEAAGRLPSLPRTATKRRVLGRQDR